MRVRDEIFVNLNHANKRSAKEFDAEGESVVNTLAVAAGVARDNARLLAEGQRGKRGRGRGGRPGSRSASIRSSTACSSPPRKTAPTTATPNRQRVLGPPGAVPDGRAEGQASIRRPLGGPAGHA